MRIMSRMAFASVFVAVFGILACGNRSSGKPSYTWQPWSQKNARSAGTSDMVRKLRAAIRADAALSKYYPYLVVAEENDSFVVSGALPSQQLKESLRAVEVRVGGDRVVDRVNAAGTQR